MTVIELDHPRDLTSWVGKDIGTSPWHRIDQAQIDAFAAAIDDHQWIHVDVARAAADMPDGKTIAHGQLVLSLVAGLSYPMYSVANCRHVLNYGMNRVRFTAPVPVDSRVRLRLDVASAEERKDGNVLVAHTATMELEGSERPACIAETLRLLIP
jgi:acyl dehydratase